MTMILRSRLYLNTDCSDKTDNPKKNPQNPVHPWSNKKNMRIWQIRRNSFYPGVQEFSIQLKEISQNGWRFQ